MSDVFVSHATKDDKAVDELYSLLTAAGLTVWVDHKNGIVPGDDWADSIHDAANDCSYGLFVMSPRSVKSKYCKAECNRVLRLDKRLYIVVIENVDVKDIPLRLDIIQQVDLTKDFDAGMNALIEAIKGRRELDIKAATVSIPRRLVNFDPRLVAIPLSGRDDDVSAIKQRLGRAPTFILGVGGLGKTRLAAEIALTSEDVRGGVWHTASEYSRADEILEGLREYFNLPNTTERREVLAKLRGENLLIVIDNAESPADERRKEYAQLVNEMYAQGAQVLFTSRVEWDEVRDPQTWTPQTLPLEAAAKVVGDMADAFSSPHAAALETHAEDFARAARQHPRLIEWAVRQTKKFAPEKVLEDLRALKSKAVQEALDEMIRKTLRQMVSEDGAALETALKKLCVCRGGFSYSAAQAILELSDDSDTLDEQLAALQTWQFVTMRVLPDGRTRYDIDALVIEAVGEDEGVHKAHYDYYLALAWQHDKRQDYFGLEVESANLETAFERAMDINVEAALWLTNACGHFLGNRGRFIQRLDWIERVYALLQNHSDVRLRANSQNTLGLFYQEHPLGDRLDRLQKSITAYEAALVYYTPQIASLDFAMTQNNLGNAYRALAAIEEREANLLKAITAYEAALVYRIPQTEPLKYAMTQNNLGSAYGDLATIEEREANLLKAITAFEAALVYWTPQTAPLDYAMTQNNLGSAYWKLSAIEEWEGNLQKAITAFEAALVYWTPLAAPLAYAIVQKNLGVIWEESGDLQKAVDCWCEAERYYRQMSIVQQIDLMREWIEDGEQRLKTTKPKKRKSGK